MRNWQYWWARPLGFLYQTAGRWAGRAVAAGAAGPIGLDESTEAFVGEVLRVTPHHGYGWTHDGREVPPPEPFRARLVRIWRHEGERRGGVARVEEPGHGCDGLWLVFSTRHAAPYDFVGRVGAYNVALGPGEPVPNATGWPVRGSSSPHLTGWAEIGALAGAPAGAGPRG